MNDEFGWVAKPYDDLDGGAYQISITTTDSATSAEALARGLVGERLAASVQIVQVQGVQRQGGEIESRSEWQLWIKTIENHADEIYGWISDHHDHDHPEIASFPITDASPHYVAWVNSELK